MAASPATSPIPALKWRRPAPSEVQHFANLAARPAQLPTLVRVGGQLHVHPAVRGRGAHRPEHVGGAR